MGIGTPELLIIIGALAVGYVVWLGIAALKKYLKS